MPDGETGPEPGAETIGAPSNVKPEAGTLPLGTVIDAGDREAIDKEGSIKTYVCTVSFILTLIVLGILFFVFILPEVLDLLEDIGTELRKEKGSAGIVILCIAGGCLFNFTPLPGRAAWNLVIGYVYGWAAFPIILAGHSIGATGGFYVARLLWPCIERSGTLQRCFSCCWMQEGKPRRTIRFIITCLTLVEEQPMRTICLLTLSPIPLSLMSYVIGAKCPSVRCWQFFIALTAGGAKLIVPTYLGVKADDMKKLVKGEENEPADMLFTVVSVFILVFTVYYISKRAYQKLKIDTEGQPVVQPITPRRNLCCAICCSIMAALGLFAFITALAILRRLSPLYEKLDVTPLPRTSCVTVRKIGMDLHIIDFTMHLTMRITNPNPIEIDATATGPIFHGMDGFFVTSISPTSFVLGAAKRPISGKFTDTETIVNMTIRFPNISVVGLPAVISVASILAGLPSQVPNQPNQPGLLPQPGQNPSPSLTPAPGPSPTPAPGQSPACSVPASGFNNNQQAMQTYIQSCAAACLDSDLTALTGNSMATCTNAKNMLGCNAALSSMAANANIPTGSLVKDVCVKTCKKPPCTRRLASSESWLRLNGTREDAKSLPNDVRARNLQALPGPMTIPLVIELNLNGKARFEVMSFLRPKKIFDSVRYQRRDMDIDISTRITNSLTQQLQTSGGSSMSLANLPVLQSGLTMCTLQAPNTSYCGSSKSDMMGPLADVVRRPSVTNCLKMGPEEDEFDKQNETKWVFCIFFMLLGCLCLCGGTIRSILNGKRYLQHSEELKADSSSSQPAPSGFTPDVVGAPPEPPRAVSPRAEAETNPCMQL